MLIAWTGEVLLGQVTNRPFVKKFEIGIPGNSNMSSIWPQNGGYWALMAKYDTTDQGNYFFGAEILNLDSIFQQKHSISHGDTAKYYFEFPIGSVKSYPDGKGNYWYWLPGYTTLDSTRRLFYGKFDQFGNILFEKVLLGTHRSDYYFDFLSLPGGSGFLTNTHLSTFGANVTWLSWLDSLGQITHRDSTQRIGQNYHHSTSYVTYDSTKSILIAPREDSYFSGFQTYNVHPGITIFDSNRSIVKTVDLDTELHNNYIGSLLPTADNGYVGWINKFIPDSTLLYEDHQPGIVKFDSSFNVEWVKYLFPRKLDNMAVTFHKSAEGYFYLAGRLDASPDNFNQQLRWFITKFSPNLDSLWTRIYNLDGDTIGNITQDPTQIQTLNDGSILVLVDNKGGGVFYTTLYRLDSNGCLISGCNIGDTIPTPPIPPTDKPPIDQPLPLLNGQLLAYPNPSTGQFNLEWDVWPGDHSELKIFDITSKTLLEMPIQREARPSVLDLSNWANGIYFLEIKANSGRVFRAKVLLQK